MSTSAPWRPVNIRQTDRNRIKESLLPGHVIQVCGPPMIGKSTLVDQAVDDSNSRTIYHKFNCENQHSFHGILNVMVETLGLQSMSTPQPNKEILLPLLASKLVQCSAFHHVLIFHKCEGLRCELLKTYGDDHLFIDFLWQIIACISGSLKVSVVFTSYKKFHLVGEKARTIEIGALSFWDVLSILQCYAPYADVLPYVKVCLNTLPLPGAVRRFAEEFLVDDDYVESPEVLEEYIEKDESFLSMVFGSKLDNVDKWVPQDILLSIVHFCNSIRSSFTLAHLESVAAGEGRVKWSRLMKRLQQNYIIWTVPESTRLAVHPLVVYYSLLCRRHNRMVLQGEWYDHSSNRYTDFLCRFLSTVETNMRKEGNKTLVYGSLAEEWPHIRHMIEMALNCNQNTYKTFLRAVVSSRGIILKCFSNEAHNMYQALYDCARSYGTCSERAVIKALLGHSKTSAAVLAKGETRQQAEDYLDSAIRELQKSGPAFALLWAICRKAIILTRQGKYKEARMCFNACKSVTLSESDVHDLEKTFGISKLQVKEEKITRDIYEANVLIFLGENELAQKMLLNSLQEMQNEYADHPEKATAKNSVGLTEERGNKDLTKAVMWYRESYADRKLFAKFSKETLVVSLNNIGMILQRLGQIDEGRKYLEDALGIRKELGWKHAHTPLTLVHLGVIHFKCGDLAKAFMTTLEAESLLQEVMKVHDSRLKVNNTLGHLKQLIDTQKKGYPQRKYEEVNSDKSPEEYFEFALQIADEITGNLSDDGCHHFLLVHEHIMLHALGNSKQKFNEHKFKILPYFHASQGIGRRICTESEKIITRHMELYTYFSTTGYDDIDKTTYVNHLAKVCEFCQMCSRFCTVEEMWCGYMQQSAISVEENEVAESQPPMPDSKEIHADLSCVIKKHTDVQNQLVNLVPSCNTHLHQEQQSLSSNPDDSLIPALLKFSTAMPDLNFSDAQYQSNVSDYYDEKSLNSSPDNSLILLLTESSEPVKDQQKWLNEIKYSHLNNNLSTSPPSSNNKIISVLEDHTRRLNFQHDSKQNESSDCANFDQNFSNLTYNYSNKKMGFANSKTSDEATNQQKHLHWENMASSCCGIAKPVGHLSVHGRYNENKVEFSRNDTSVNFHDSLSASFSLQKESEHRNEYIPISSLPLNIPAIPDNWRSQTDQTSQHIPSLLKSFLGQPSLDSLSDNELIRCGSDCDHL